MRIIEQSETVGGARHQNEGELDLRSVAGALWRKKLWMIGPALLVMVLAIVAVNLVTPRYKSEGRVLLETRENVFLRPEAEKLGDRERSVLDAEAVTSQVQVVLSRDLARQVIRQLKLGELPEFDPVLKGVSPVKQVLILLGVAKDPLRMSPEERVLEAYYERITAYPVDKSRVIAVEFQSTDPDLAARVANAIIENFLTFQQSAKQDQTRAASQWLAGEIDGLRKRVAEAEQKAEDFRGRSNLLIGTNNTTLSNQGLGELNTQVSTARAQRADAEARAKMIREMLKSGQQIEASEIVNSELIRRLAEQRVTLRAQLAEQSSTLLNGHPRIKELRAQIGDLERQIRSEAEKLARTLENDAKLAGTRVETLASNLDQMKRQAVSTNEQDVQLRALERESKAQRELLESYLAKYREATARDSLGSAPAEARIISRAIASSTPFFPKKLPIVAIVSLATLLLAVGFITTGELLAGNVYRSSGPIAAREPESMRLLVDAVPQKRSLAVPASVAVEDPGEEPGSVEKIAALIAAAGEAAHRISVVGWTSGVGATSTALSVARHLAKDKRVVLIDLAIASGSLSSASSDPGAPGIIDLVRGSASFGQIIQRDRGSQAHLVGAGRAEGDLSGILSAERLTIAIDALAQTYDHVVVDAGRFEEIAKERVARLAPWGLLVAREVAGSALSDAEQQLRAAGFADVTPVLPVSSPDDAQAAA